MFSLTLLFIIFLYASLGRENKAKISKQDYAKLKSFCTGKGTIIKSKMPKQQKSVKSVSINIKINQIEKKRRKMPPSKWEKISANDTCKCLISKINNSYNSTNEQITQLKNGLSRHFYKEDTQMVNSHMEDAQHHQENASQNHSKISHHICQSSY